MDSKWTGAMGLTGHGRQPRMVPTARRTPGSSLRQSLSTYRSSHAPQAASYRVSLPRSHRVRYHSAVRKWRKKKFSSNQEIIDLSGCKSKVLLGIEPRSPESESEVIPLHYKTADETFFLWYTHGLTRPHFNIEKWRTSEKLSEITADPGLQKLGLTGDRTQVAGIRIRSDTTTL